jgi:3-oxoacyl-[acyl-carrier protein] reductase
MNFGIENRIALITGASKGIGKAISIALASEGTRCILVSRSCENLEKLRAELKNPERHTVVAADLMKPEEILSVVNAVHSIGNLDIIVHNLGGSAGVFDAMAPAADWAKVWHFNVGICHELNRLLLPGMIERRWGRIVHLSTLSTETYNGYAPYVSAKCALKGYIKNISRSMARHNVIISAVSPGAIYSEGRHFARLQKEDPAQLEKYFDDHLPARRLGTGDDVASTVAFLCSEQASFMVGTIVSVDGGGM